MPQPTLKYKAYKYIKDKILSCEYAPGDFLDEKKIIKEINSSRTPIREALNKIEQENLIKIIPKKGVLVNPIDLKDIIDIYQLRDLIEPSALLNYGGMYEKDKLLEFKKLFSDKSLTPIDFYKADDMFHTYIIDVYKNHYVEELMEVMREQNQRLRILTGRFYDENSAGEEHIKIIDALLSDNFELAENEMKNHIELSKQRTLNAYTSM